MANTLNIQALIDKEEGDTGAPREGYARAPRFLSEAIDLNRASKNAMDIGINYVNSAAYRLSLSDVDGARKSVRDALRIGRQGRVELVIAVALQHLAQPAALNGDSRRAARLPGCVGARYTDLGNRREFTEQWGYDKMMAALREALSEDEIATPGAEGAASSEDRAVEEALQV